MDGVDKIKLNATRKTKNERLVNIIRGYKRFIEALFKNKQKHVAKIIKDEQAGLKLNTLNLVLIQKCNVP